MIQFLTNLINLSITLYLIGAIITAFKMAYDVYNKVNQTIPFWDCFKRVVFDIKSYEYILKWWTLLK